MAVESSLKTRPALPLIGSKPNETHAQFDFLLLSFLVALVPLLTLLFVYH